MPAVFLYRCLSDLLYAARAGAAFELTKTAAASKDVRELSASIETHDQLYGDLAPTRRSGLESQRREMRHVVTYVGGGVRVWVCRVGVPCGRVSVLGVGVRLREVQAAAVACWRV